MRLHRAFSYVWPLFFCMNVKNGHPGILVYAVAFLIVVIWGCTFVQTKLLINAGLRPDEIFLFRFVIAYVLMLPFSGRRLWLDNWRDELLAFSLGLTGGSLYFITENYALAYGYCSNVSLIVCLTPIITAVIVGCFYRNERMDRTGIAGSCIAFAGMVLVVFNGNFILKLSPLGDVLAFAACLCWALYTLMIKRLQGSYSNMLITRKVFGYGLLTIIPWLLPNGVNVELLFCGRAVVWGNILFLGCVASMFCFLVWNWCLARLGAVRATNMLYLNPIVAITSSALILGERVTWLAIAGTVLILLGLACLDSRPAKRREAAST